MAKIKVNYQTTVADGRMNVRLLEKSTDGKFHSAGCEYPLYMRELDADGNEQVVKYTRKQTEKYLLARLGIKAQSCGRRKNQK